MASCEVRIYQDSKTEVPFNYCARAFMNCVLA